MPAPDGPEERTVELGAMPGGDEVGVEARERVRVDREEAGFPALAEDLEVADAAAVVDVADVEVAELGASQPVVKEHREDRAIAKAGERRLRRRVEERPRLAVADRRRAALVGALLRPRDAVDGIDGNGVAFAEVGEERRKRGELPPDGRGRKLAGLERAAPGDDVGARDLAKPGWIRKPEEPGEVADGVAVDAAGAGVRDVREPLRFGRDVREAAEGRILERDRGDGAAFDGFAHVRQDSTITCENPFFRK